MNVVLDIGTAPLRLALNVVPSVEPGVTVVGMISETEGLLRARPVPIWCSWSEICRAV